MSIPTLSRTHLQYVSAIRWTHLPEGISLVAVEASLHAHDGHAVEQAEHHLTVVTGHRRHREVGDLLVRKRLALLQMVHQAACGWRGGVRGHGGRDGDREEVH